ncbi:hypothetical protein P8452_68948 [Trifolium repens]|nr:hypothetical protein P8452_68948 [Trifolium repens]
MRSRMKRILVHNSECCLLPAACFLLSPHQGTPASSSIIFKAISNKFDLSFLSKGISGLGPCSTGIKKWKKKSKICQRK